MKHNELHDMPLELMPVPISSPKVANITLRAIRNVTIDKGLRNSAEQAYRAWLGYYNGQLKKVRWDKKKLVEQANLWASEIGLPEQPSIEKRTVGKMGLKGVPGLKIV
jgi:ATP-dependent RNA helicase MSS116